MLLFAASTILLVTLAISAYRIFNQATERPGWLYKLQVASVFAGAYVIIQTSSTYVFFTFASVLLLSIHLYDRKYTAHKPREAVSLLTDFSRDMWLFVILFTLFRAFIYDYSAVPSGSMEPTLYAGDLIAVNKYAYHAKLAPFKTPFVSWAEPKPGDVVVFESLDNRYMHYVKRVIAGPGDHVVYQNKTYFVNGVMAEHTDKKFAQNKKGWQESARETLGDKQHAIQLDQLVYNRDEIDMIVPEGHYFVSGDNRDFSYDSRYFGTVPKAHIVGKVSHVIFQFSYPVPISFSRSGTIE